MQSSATDEIFQLIPLMVLQLVYVVIVFVTARKRGVNPWFWAIGSLVPVFGLFVAGVFMLVSFLSILDRLNVLEKQSPFD